MSKAAKLHNVAVSTCGGHTLYDMEQLLSLAGAKPPTAYKPFLKLLDKCGEAAAPLPAPDQGDTPPCPVPPGPPLHGPGAVPTPPGSPYGVPDLAALGYTPPGAASPFPGGETEGLKRLATKVESRPKWVGAFAKPSTSPTALQPDTTALSPYLKFGAVSPRSVLAAVRAACAAAGASPSPPTSLEGQLLWREFYYFQAINAQHYDTMVGSSVSRQIGWDHDPAKVAAWAEARTGYPWIDACMTQLREEGWLHHLGRHAVACFLTRGDLYQNWEEGAKVFDRLLIDSDWPLNCGNWMWLSASAYFHQFFRVYSPVAFPKKTDPNGDYVRKWLPALASLPKKYIYEPWKAPRSVQESCGVVVGETYPARIVIHEEMSKANIARHSAAYKAAKPGSGMPIPTAVSGVGATQVGSAPPPTDAVGGAKRAREGDSGGGDAKRARGEA